MKKTITTAAFLWAMVGMLSAQTIMGPKHPLNMKTMRSMADSTTRETYLEGGSDKPMYPFSSAIYKYSKDFLTDTIINYSGLIAVFINKYDSEGRQVYESSYFPREVEINGKAYLDREWNRRKYTYDTDGKLLKLETYDKDYNNPAPDKLYVKSDYKYHMTDSGYMVERTTLFFDDVNVTKAKTEYVLDKKGRVIRKIDRDEKDQYVADDDGRRYRIGDVYYSYTDSGYTEIRYIRADFCTKTDLIFNKKGLLKKENVYVRKGKEPWVMNDSYGYFDFYKAGNPYSNIEVGKTSGNIYATEGGVMIETELPVSVGVYTFGGQLLRRERIGSGITRVPLSKGLYIVSVNGIGYKISVR